MTDSNFKPVSGKIGAKGPTALSLSPSTPTLQEPAGQQREAGLLPQGASQAQGETGLCDCQQVQESSFKSNYPEVITLPGHGY